MNPYVAKLRECKSIQEASPILDKIRAGPAVRKLVETALILNNHPDASQRQHGLSFLQAALQEMDAAEQPTNMPHDNGIKPSGDHFKKVREELLDNHNPESGNAGSEGSSDNTEPYPKEGENEPNDAIESMEGGASHGENQMKEMNPTAPGIIAGMEPTVAEQMGAGMGQIPPMNTPQMMRQMQYTAHQALVNYDKKYAGPMRNLIKQQREAIKTLSHQIQELEASRGSMKLDINQIKRDSPVRAVTQETTGVTNVINPITHQPITQVHSKNFEKQQAGAEIAELDRALRSRNGSQPYL